MAVPKNKRYKQVVRSRRFYQKNKLIMKKRLILCRFKNYLPLQSNVISFRKKINNKLLFYSSFIKNLFNPIKYPHNIFRLKYTNTNLSLYELIL